MLVNFSLTKVAFFLAEAAKVWDIIVNVSHDLLFVIAKAMGMNPFATGTFALEHLALNSLIMRVVWHATEAVQEIWRILILSLLRQIFRADIILFLLSSINISSNEQIK